MSAEFDAATAVTPLGDGRYSGRIEVGWDIAGNANGGYLLALAGRAMADATGRPPLTLTAHFLSPGKVGACEIDVTIVRAGRRTTTAQARITIAGTDVMVLLGTFADQAPGGLSSVTGSPPDLPPFAECARVALPGDPDAFGSRVHVRVLPTDVGFANATPSGVAEVRGWFTFADTSPEDQSIDAIGLLQATDAFAPVCFNVPGVPIGWAPTLELTAHIRGTPVAGPLRCRMSSRFLQDGLFEEDGEIFDAAGRLVAQSRQLALIPRPFTAG